MRWITLPARRWGMVLWLTLALAAVRPSPALADEPPPNQLIPGEAMAALTADLDGDGASELLRLTDPGGPGFEIERWSLNGSTWGVAGSVRLEPDVADGSRPADGTDEAAALLRWARDGRDGVLAVTGVTQGLEFPSMCCVEFWKLASSEDGLELVQLPAEEATAETIEALDLDADGTDELLLWGVRQAGAVEPGTSWMRVLRWQDGRFEPIYERESAGNPFDLTVGDSDGVQGDEIYVSPVDVSGLERLVWRDGAVESEVGSLGAAATPDGWVVAAAAGAIVLVAENGMTSARWPRDTDPVVNRVGGYPFPQVAIVGDGPEAVLVTQEFFGFDGEPDGSANVYDLDLDLLGIVPQSVDSAPMWELAQRASLAGTGVAAGRGLMPWAGRFPGDVDGRPAYVTGGSIILPGGPDGYRHRSMAPLVGMAPFGRAGEGDAWVTLGDGLIATGGRAHLYAFGDIVGVPEGRIAMAPLETVLDSDPDLELASIDLRGAVEVGSPDPGVVSLVAQSDGFEVVVTAPPGTVVLIIGQGRTPFATEHVIDQRPVVDQILPRRNGSDARDQAFERRLLILAATGQASLVRWEGIFVREPPELRASASVEAFSLTAEVLGRAGDLANVTVDGVPAELNRNGAFSVDVDAPIWPRNVMVVARDPLGNESVVTLEVVGLLDYRGLPWIPILGVATVAAGAVLFIRTPRRRGERAVGLGWGDATLEEIDADRI